MKRSGNVFPSDITQGQYISLQRSCKVSVVPKWRFLPYGFSLITFEPSTIEIKFERHRVPLLKTHRKYTCWPRKVKVKIWPQVMVTAWPKLHISRSVLTRQTHWDHFHVSSFSQSQVIGKNCWWPRVTSYDFSGVTDQHLTLGHHEWPKSTWSWKNCALLMRWEEFQYFPPLTYNGEFRSLTWPQVI